MTDADHCPKPDPAAVRKAELQLKRGHFYGSGGLMLIIGYFWLVTEALTSPRVPWVIGVPMALWASHCAFGYVFIYRHSLWLLRDRNFWRKSATHDLDQLHADVMRQINDGEEWKR